FFLKNREIIKGRTMWKKHKWLIIAIFLLVIYVIPLFIFGGIVM
ncbi:conserved hypothetical protein, partial [Listeria ivanovii FSL F6-596]